uniref:Fucosyltransferase n=1 Tax=Meloidogyne incognita TaxID=6306 RepID=A0A914LGN5_MELIC
MLTSQKLRRKGHRQLFSANHMFYLAFENSVCKEYITEKFWNLKHLIVPIVLSRRIFNNTKIPDNVYIAVDDFNNVEELAKYLLYLQKNETAYLKPNKGLSPKET